MAHINVCEIIIYIICLFAICSKACVVKKPLS